MADVILALTEQGQALKAKIEEGEGTLPLEITRIVSAAGTSEDPVGLTDLVDPKIELSITGSRTDGARTIISAMLTNTGNPEKGVPPLEVGYNLVQVGFYAVDPDEGEILYRITQYENPIPIPAASERGWTYTPTYNIVTGNATEVIIVIDSSSYATMQDLMDNVGNLQCQITTLEERLALLEYMTLQNDFSVPLATDDEEITLIVDDSDFAILADWRYIKEV